MSKVVCRAARLAASCGALLAAAAFAAPPPIEAFGRKPALNSVDLSPSGTRIALIEDDGESAHIVLHDLVANQTLRNIRIPKQVKLWRVRWASEDTVVIRESAVLSLQADQKYTDEWQRWVAVDATTGPERVLLMRDGDARDYVSFADLLRVRTANPGKVFMSTYDWSSARQGEEIGTRLVRGRKDSGWSLNAYEVDLKSGDGRVIAAGTPYTSDWLVDASGELIARTEFNPKSGDFKIQLRDGKAWRELYAANGCEQLNLVTFSADQKSLVVNGRVCGENQAKLWSLPLDGSARSVLFADSSLDVEDAFLDPVDGHLVGVALGGADQRTEWLDDATKTRLNSLKHTFGGRDVTIVSKSADGARVVVRVDDAMHPITYYLVDFTTKKADIVNEAYPLLADVQLGEVRVFDYKARDDYALLAYLTLPPGSDGKNLPLVVLPHGGPESRDDRGFDWITQFLASRGYAVLQPQFRGSTGFGQAHADAGRHQWGLRMQDDVTDGVKAAIAQGIADPKRVCIVGASYGGYAALAGAAFTPELYACAVSIGGVSDLPALIGNAVKYGGHESDAVAYWRDHIGAASDPQVIARSPVNAVDKIRAPILLIHGTDDTVVPIVQSRVMERALRDANKPVEFIEIEGDDHWFMTSSASRIRMLTELERFLGKNLGTAPAPAAAN